MIVYKPSKENSVADALSRREDEQVMAGSGPLLISDGVHYALTTITSNLLDTLRTEVQQDLEL